MKYLAAFYLLFSLQSFAQKQEEIFFQTHPEGKYLISYTSGEYTFLFNYDDFLKQVVWTPEDRAQVKQFIDGRINVHGFVEITSGERFILNGKETDLQEISSDFEIASLIEKGNLMIQDRSGKTSLSSVVMTYQAKTEKPEKAYVYTNPATGEQLFKREIHNFVGTGCPSF